MNARTEERVEGWPSRPFTDGHEGLRELADRDFSGVVETDRGAWLCMLNGKVVGVFEGSIDDYEDASGTTYDAPDPALPLLFAMQEHEGTVEEEYYTQDTPISEAHETLSSGSFTGFIELSENVLSGDYYVLYYGGRSMSVAFVGSSDRLVTGEDAFERADSEVGIYEVRSVDVEVVDVPEPDPEPDEPARTDDGDASDERAPESAPTSTRPGASAAAESPTEATGPSAGATATGDGETRTDEPPDASEPGDPDAPESGSARPDETASPARSAGSGETRPSRGTTAAGDPLADPGGDASSGGADGAGTDRPTEPAGADRTSPGPDRRDEPAGDRRFRDEAAWRRNPSVPSIADSDVDDDRLEELEAALDEHEAALEGLHDRLQAVDREAANDRDRLRGGLDDLSDDLSDLRRTVMRLDQAVDRIEDGLEDRIRRIVAAEVSDRTRASDRVEAGAGSPDPSTAEPAADRADAADATPAGADTAGGSDADAATGSSAPAAGDGPDLDVETALEETTLLVRYGSQGKPTLKSAHGGGADREEVNDNLRIDAHTPFDADAATVEGEPFRAFLEGRMEYRFFEWVVRDLLYEIRETGNDTALEQLYDALPRIDRAEMHGSVTAPTEADDDETMGVGFDVVARDARGTPLVVANLNDSRDPATQGMVVELNDRATRVREGAGLSGAFLVTASYFEGEARETAEDATSGSLLSRDSRKSFVKLSRKRGYHLCLVEANDGGFHVSVPEL